MVKKSALNSLAGRLGVFKNAQAVISSSNSVKTDADDFSFGNTSHNRASEIWNDADVSKTALVANRKWVELFGQISLLIGDLEEIHIRDCVVVSAIPKKYELAVFSAKPMARRIFQLCEAAQSNSLPIHETVFAMLQDESKPLVLRLGFDDLTADEHMVLSRQPHSPFLHLAPSILTVLGGLITLPEYLSHLTQISPHSTLMFDRQTLGRISIGMVPNINIFPTGVANGS